MLDFVNEKEIALLLAKHFEKDNHFDFSKISVENKEELMKVLRKRRPRIKGSKQRTEMKPLVPVGTAPVRGTKVVGAGRRGRPRQQPAHPVVVHHAVHPVSSHTMMVNTDLLTLGSVVPGCDPRVEPPGLVMSKARWYILRLEDALQKALSTRQAPANLKKCSLDRTVNQTSPE